MHGLAEVDEEGVDGARGVGDVFGEDFQPDDLPGVGPGRRGQLGRSREVAGEAGVDEVGGDPGGAQQAARGLGDAQLPAAGQVAGGRAVRFEAEQGRAPTAHREAGLGVEECGAGGGRGAGGAEPGLEGAEAQLGAEHSVAVLVDQVGHGHGVGHPGLPGTACLRTA